MNTEMRWLVRPGWDGPEKVLQYRVKVDVNVWAGMPTQEQIQKHANYQWTPWTDVPVIEDV